MCFSHAEKMTMMREKPLMILSLVNPNLHDPVNFVPFGTMIYSIVAINLKNIHEHNLHRICSDYFLDKA